MTNELKRAEILSPHVTFKVRGETYRARKIGALEYAVVRSEHHRLLSSLLEGNVGMIEAFRISDPFTYDLTYAITLFTKTDPPVLVEVPDSWKEAVKNGIENCPDLYFPVEVLRAYLTAIIPESLLGEEKENENEKEEREGS